MQPSLPYSLIGDEPELDPEQHGDKIREMHRLAKAARKVLETTSVGNRAGDRKEYVPKNLQTCSHVYIKRGNKKGMERAWDGQYEVCGRSEHAIWIRYKDGSTDEIAIDRCKPARRLPGDEDDRTPEKRRRGRPKSALKQVKETDGVSEERKKVAFATNEKPEESPENDEEPVRRRPGRPRGSKTDTTDKTMVKTRVFTRSKKN